jgi:hypothetical protein
LFNGGTLSPETTLYLGLCTGLTLASDDVVGEPDIGTNAYERVQLTVATVFGTASGGNISNASVISFPESTGAWSSGTNLGYWFLASASTGTKYIYGGSIDNGTAADGTKVDATGQTISFKVGQLVLKGEGL